MRECLLDERESRTWRVELLEEDLCHLLAVGFGVERRFGEHDWVLFGRDAQFVVEGVVPDLLHVVPVGDDAMLDRVANGEDAFLGECLVADVRVFVAHAGHDGGVVWSADSGRKDGARCIFATEAGFDHA